MSGCASVLNTSLIEHEILKMSLVVKALNQWELTVIKADMIRIIKSEISASV
jgi:hypothetical protein